MAICPRCGNVIPQIQRDPMILKCHYTISKCRYPVEHRSQLVVVPVIAYYRFIRVLVKSLQHLNEHANRFFYRPNIPASYIYSHYDS